MSGFWLKFQDSSAVIYGTTNYYFFFCNLDHLADALVWLVLLLKNWYQKTAEHASLMARWARWSSLGYDMFYSWSRGHGFKSQLGRTWGCVLLSKSDFKYITFMCISLIWDPWWLSGLDEHLSSMKCSVCDLEAMGLNLLDELRVCNLAIQVALQQKIKFLKFVPGSSSKG